jgi:hypothetical protein
MYLRGIMAARAKHDGRVRQSEPVVIVNLEIANQLPYKSIPFACHHKPDREASWMRRGCDEAKSSERP